MLLKSQKVSGKPWERAFQHADHAVLLRVQHAALLAHRLRVGDDGAEEAVPLEPPVETGPVVVPVPSVGQTPGDERVEPSGHGVAGLASFHAGARAAEGALAATAFLDVV